jgi:hypothetical protein
VHSDGSTSDSDWENMDQDSNEDDQQSPPPRSKSPEEGSNGSDENGSGVEEKEDGNNVEVITGPELKKMDQAETQGGEVGGVHLDENQKGKKVRKVKNDLLGTPLRTMVTRSAGKDGRKLRSHEKKK